MLSGTNISAAETKGENEDLNNYLRLESQIIILFGDYNRQIS